MEHAYAAVEKADGGVGYIPTSEYQLVDSEESARREMAKAEGRLSSCNNGCGSSGQGLVEAIHIMEEVWRYTLRFPQVICGLALFMVTLLCVFNEISS